MNSSFCHAVDKFYSAAVTVGEAGKCSATVSHRSDAASMCATQQQPELLRLHLDRSSLPRMRMLKLTGLSFSSPALCSQALSSSSFKRRSFAHCLFVSQRPQTASLFVYCDFVPVLRSFFSFWLKFTVLSYFLSRVTFFLSVLNTSCLKKKKMEVERRADTVALEHF